MTDAWRGRSCGCLLAVLPLLVAGPSACVSDPATASGPEGGSPTTQGTTSSGFSPPGFAFDYLLDHGGTTPPMTLCHLRFGLLGGKTTVETKLIPEAAKILVKVPAGRYKLLSADCDSGRAFSLPPDFVFPVEAGKVTFLGRATLSQGMISKKAERDQLSFDDKDTESNRDALADLQARHLTVIPWHWHASARSVP